jgi:hypothetical protein
MIGYRILTAMMILPGLFVFSGCGGEQQLGQVPVKAIVKVNGTPVEGAAVLFVDAQSNSSSALTGANGVAVLKSSIIKDNRTVEVTGVLPGEYQVAINKSVTEQMPDPENPLLVKIKSVEHVVPVMYNSYLKSGLTASVKKGDPNEFVFDLKSQ